MVGLASATFSELIRTLLGLSTVRTSIKPSYVTFRELPSARPRFKRIIINKQTTLEETHKNLDTIRNCRTNGAIGTSIHGDVAPLLTDDCVFVS